MSEIHYKEVNFLEYCKKCKHEKKKGHEDPCNECLEEGMNRHTQRPVKWKKKDA